MLFSALQSSYHAIYIAGIQVQCVQYQDCGTQCTLLPAPPLQWNSDNSCSEIEDYESYITDEPSETDGLDEDEVPANLNLVLRGKLHVNKVLCVRKLGNGVILILLQG